MTAATSVFGMLPLVLAPGAGSELYRGLGAVVVGGAAAFGLLVGDTLIAMADTGRYDIAQNAGKVQAGVGDFGVVVDVIQTEPL